MALPRPSGILCSGMAGGRRHLLLWPLSALPFTSSALATAVNVRAVYHLSEGVLQAKRAFLYIQNHLSADPQAHIVVVAHAAGVDALLDSPEDDESFEREVAIRHLLQTGRVAFVACGITLATRKIDPGRLFSGVTLVHSGVAEISRLQANEGFAYLHP